MCLSHVHFKIIPAKFQFNLVCKDCHLKFKNLLLAHRKVKSYRENLNVVYNFLHHGFFINLIKLK